MLRCNFVIEPTFLWFVTYELAVFWLCWNGTIWDFPMVAYTAHRGIYHCSKKQQKSPYQRETCVDKYVSAKISYFLNLCIHNVQLFLSMKWNKNMRMTISFFFFILLLFYYMIFHIIWFYLFLFYSIVLLKEFVLSGYNSMIDWL